VTDPTTTGDGEGPTRPALARSDAARRSLGVAAWVVVFSIALIARAGWGVYRIASAHDPAMLEFPDEQQYWLIAQSLRAGEGLRDELGFRATRMPLYPAVLSLFSGAPHGVVAAKALHWVIGALAAAMTAVAATAWTNRRVGIAAGLLAACDPFLIFFSSLLLTETFFIAASLVLWWLIADVVLRPPVSRRRWFVVGLSAALCVYLRESAAGSIVLLLAVVVALRRFDRRAVAGAAIAGGIVVAALLPWAARNRAVCGKWCWLTHRSGISLYDGVGPRATGASNLGDVKQTPAVRGMGEVEWNRYFLRESWRSIRDDPARIARLMGVKLARTWNPFPNVDAYRSRAARWVAAGWTTPIYAFAAAMVMLAAVRGGRRDRIVVIVMLLPAIYLSALHGLFVGSVRYRLAAMPMLLILAATALERMTPRRRGRPAVGDRNDGCDVE